MARRIALNPANLPYNREFLDWLLQEKKSGRPLWLCTGAPRLLADAVADHLAIFDGVLATSATENFTGETKARGLVAQFGDHGFDYCGNEEKDLAVWRVSHGGVVVNGGKGLESRAAAVTQVLAVFARLNTGSLHAVVRSMRLLQWAKNIMVFVPLVAAHRIMDPLALKSAVMAFFAFGFCASSVYLLNDMLDLEADRQHPVKSKRPFAAGELPLTAGLALIPVLLLVSFLFALRLPTGFLLALAGYYLLTTIYSFVLKRIPIVDTLCLACLYTIRIVAGAVATAVPLSFWLLLFSVFFFLSLAFVKRCAELDMILRNRKEQAPGRDYLAEDLPLLKMFGIAAGYLSVLVLALYINSPAVVALYRCPEAIWFLCLLVLYWINRLWLKTHRGKMHDDPVVFALKDKVSFIVGLLSLLTLLAAV